jgi:hypothetical protein
MLAFLITRVAASQLLSSAPWDQAANAPASDLYIGAVVAVMFLAGWGILVVRLIKAYRNRSRNPPRKAVIQQMRRRFRGAA